MDLFEQVQLTIRDTGTGERFEAAVVELCQTGSNFGRATLRWAGQWDDPSSRRVRFTVHSDARGFIQGQSVCKCYEITGPATELSMVEENNDMMLELIEGERGWLRVGGWPGASTFGVFKLPKRKNWGEAPEYARWEHKGEGRVRACRMPGYAETDPEIKVTDQRGWEIFQFQSQGFVRSWEWTAEGNIKCILPVRARRREDGTLLEALPEAYIDGTSIENMKRDLYSELPDFVVIELERDPADVGWETGPPPEKVKKTKEKSMATTEITSTKIALAKATKEGLKLGALSAFTGACTTALLKFMVSHGLPKRMAKAKWLTPVVALIALALARVLFAHLGKVEGVRVADKALELEVAKISETGFTALFEDVLPLAMDAAKHMGEDDE